MKNSTTCKVHIGKEVVYFTLALDNEGQPNELLHIKYPGDKLVQSLLSCIGRLVTTLLKLGVPVETVAKELEWQRDETGGYTDHPEIKNCNSIVDFIGKWIKFNKKEGVNK